MTVTSFIGLNLIEKEVIGKPVTLFQGEESPVIGKVTSYDSITGEATMKIDDVEFAKLPWKKFLGISSKQQTNE